MGSAAGSQPILSAAAVVQYSGSGQFSGGRGQRDYGGHFCWVGLWRGLAANVGAPPQYLPVDWGDCCFTAALGAAA